MSEELAVTNARVITPTGRVDGGVQIEDGRITAVGSTVDGTGADTVVDAGGLTVLPGLIDLHGDEIEKHLMPRAGARIDTEMALLSADRESLAAGITTKYHAVSFKHEPASGRTPDLAAELTMAVSAADALLADHRVHIRCEVTQADAVAAAIDHIDRAVVDLVSVMSHIPGKGQFEDVDAFLAYYENSTNHTLEEAHAYIAERTATPMAAIRERVDRVIAHAQAAGIVTASHDDESPDEVERLHAAGVSISEYPITMATAARAHELGMTTVMGAPNLLLGGSQWGNLDSATAIEAGVVDALCVDYHPPSLLAAAFVDTGEPLSRRVARVTANPADAVGLSDRGRLAPGARADLVLVDPDPTPVVARVFVAGEEVYRTRVHR
jgi:alpha-D-ribose 1-methylphosphonate 5-triphosphate diphosphatase